MTERYDISPDVLSQEVCGETVLLDLAGEAYFGLNEVGTRIWQLLKEGCTATEVVDALEREFDAARDVLEADVAALIEQMLKEGIIRPEA
jgi:hypothetical protein